MEIYKTNGMHLLIGLWYIVNENELSNEDLDKLDDGLAYVYSVIGDDTSITGREIRDALWYYYFDYEETIGWALGMLLYCLVSLFINVSRMFILERMAKDKAIEDKKKEKEMAKKGK
jgi:hypothetical protein